MICGYCGSRLQWIDGFCCYAKYRIFLIYIIFIFYWNFYFVNGRFFWEVWFLFKPLSYMLIQIYLLLNKLVFSQRFWFYVSHMLIKVYLLLNFAVCIILGICYVQHISSPSSLSSCSSVCWIWNFIVSVAVYFFNQRKFWTVHWWLINDINGFQFIFLTRGNFELFIDDWLMISMGFSLFF